MNFARFVVGVAILTIFVIDPAVTKLAAAATKTAAAAKPATVSAAAVTADVNLRKSPATNSELITLIPKGALVVVGTCVSGWCQVAWNGKVGYSIAGNLNQGGSALASQRPIGGDESAPPHEPPIVADGPAPARQRPIVADQPVPSRQRPILADEPAPSRQRPIVVDEPGPSRQRPIVADEYDYPPPPSTYGPPPDYADGSQVYYEEPVYYAPYYYRPFGFGFGWRGGWRGGWGFRHHW